MLLQNADLSRSSAQLSSQF